MEQLNAENIPNNVTDISEPEMQRLRTLLLGKEYEELLDLLSESNSTEQHSEKISKVISEAIQLRVTRDKSVSIALSSTIEDSLSHSITNDPHKLADALYPVMGPAIRKSIHSILSQTLDNFNQVLEQSLSPRSLLWRFDAWRTGQTYAEIALLKTLEYQVEQVFLIHTETGLLLRHAVAPQAISKDPDLVSGMMTAIKDFISDSFDVNGNDELKTMRLGDLTVLLESGPHAVLAAVVRGNPPSDFNKLLESTQEEIHQQMGNTLKDFQGDSEDFVRAHHLLEKCLVVQQQTKSKKRKPWLFYTVIAGLLSAGLFYSYQSYQKEQAALLELQQQEQAALLAQQQQQQIELKTQQALQQRMTRMDEEPGVIVIEGKIVEEGFLIKGLKDPIARHPIGFIKPMTSSSDQNSINKPLKIIYELKPYFSAEPSISLLRAKRILKPNSETDIRLNRGVLQIKGMVSQDWHNKLQTVWSSLPGVNQLDVSQLRIKKPPVDHQKILLEKINNLIKAVESSQYKFDVSVVDVDVKSKELVQQAKKIKQLLKLLNSQKQRFSIQLIGINDASGKPEINRKLTLERVANLKSRLVSLQVPQSILSIGPQVQSNRDERSIRYKVFLNDSK